MTEVEELGSKLSMHFRITQQSSPIVASFLLACQPIAAGKGGPAVRTTDDSASQEHPYAETSPDESCKPKDYCQNFDTFAAQQFELFLNSETAHGDILTAPQGGPQSQALRLQASGKETARVQIDLEAQGLNGAQLFGRSWLLLESAPNTAVHWNLLSVSGKRADGLRASYAYGGQHPVTGAQTGSQLMAHYETPDFYQGEGEGSDCWQHSSQQAMPTDRWVCVEWKFSRKDNSMALWLDGRSIASLSVKNKGQGCVHQGPDYQWQAPAFEKFWLGWESYQPDSQRTLWLADLRLSPSQRIGCD